ncbi:MAG: hypothetical protein ACD_73C00328G0001 [uncultured bacterium]|nr:MAG: hypothetical protein ACD_73C00328G0001 [uncultured bacterium]
MPSFNRILRNALPITFNLSLHIIFGVSFGLIIPVVRNIFLKKSVS